MIHVNDDLVVQHIQSAFRQSLDLISRKCSKEEKTFTQMLLGARFPQKKSGLKKPFLSAAKGHNRLISLSFHTNSLLRHIILVYSLHGSQYPRTISNSIIFNEQLEFSG